MSLKSWFGRFVALLVAAVLCGCGGSGVVKTASRSISGTVVLPSGLSGSFSASVGLTSGQVTSGSFGLHSTANTYQVVSLLDTDADRVVLLGMLPPDQTVLQMDAANCARALTFMSLGGSQLTQAERKSLYDAIAAHSSVDALASVISAELATDRFALENGNTNIKTALDTAVAALSSSVPTSGTRIAGGAPVTRDGTLSPSYVLLNDPGYIRIMRPTEKNGGVSIDNSWGNVEGSFFTYDKGFISKDGKIFFQDYVPLGGEVVVDPLTASAAVQTPLVGDHDTEFFVSIVLRPTFDQPEPELFSDTRVAPFVATYRAILAKMYQRGLTHLAGLTMLEAFGAPQVDVNRTTLNQVIAGLTPIGSASTVYADAGAGLGLSSLLARMAAIPGGSESDAFSTLAALAPLLKSSFPDLADKLATKSLTSEQIQPFRGAMKILSAMGSWNLSTTSGKIARDYTTGTRAKDFLGSTYIALFDVTPPTGSEFEAGKSVLVTMTPKPGVTGPLTYKCELVPGVARLTGGTLNDAQGHVGSTITAASNTFYLVSSSDSVGNAHIQVTATGSISGGSTRTQTKTVIYSPQGTLRFEPFGRDYTANGHNYIQFDSGVWITKPAAVGGVYAAGKLRVNMNWDNAILPGVSGPIAATYYGEFNIPAHSGPTIPTSQVLFTGGQGFIGPVVVNKTSPWIGLSVYDYGDKLFLSNYGSGGNLSDPGGALTQAMLEVAGKTSARYSLK